MKRILDAFGKLNPVKQPCVAVALCAMTAIVLPAQTYTLLDKFDETNGENPNTSLVQASNGYLYGTTSGGGAGECGKVACGTAFKMTPAGTLTTVHNFDGTDGQYPSTLIQATNGYLYGTTSEGGANGYGTVFKMTLAGAVTTLYSFCSLSGCADGRTPLAGLVQASNGDLYGTTEFGGANSCIFGTTDYGCGTVFKITPSGTLTTLYSFCSLSACADGEEPYAGLVQGNNGELYGTTYDGGANGAYGTVFKITPAGALTTLYSFCSLSGCTDGYGPGAGLVQAANGDLYGTTVAGGTGPFGGGTAFEITPTGTLTTIHSFCLENGCTDGETPNGLIQATNGYLIGTTSDGGANGAGMIFKMTPSGTISTQYSFCSQGGVGVCTDGSTPRAAVVQNTNGAFYGAASIGGTDNWGTVYRLSLGLGPFVETLPTSGAVGSAVAILGTDLTGATSVTFNGTAATFTVVSASEITTTVPSGATSGTVEVGTPTSTLSSNVPFRVP